MAFGNKFCPLVFKTSYLLPVHKNSCLLKQITPHPGLKRMFSRPTFSVELDTWVLDISLFFFAMSSRISHHFSTEKMPLRCFIAYVAHRAKKKCWLIASELSQFNGLMRISREKISKIQADQTNQPNLIRTLISWWFWLWFYSWFRTIKCVRLNEGFWCNDVHYELNNCTGWVNDSVKFIISLAIEQYIIL